MRENRTFPSPHEFFYSYGVKERSHLLDPTVAIVIPPELNEEDWVCPLRELDVSTKKSVYSGARNYL
ncbi:hypothetical protein BC938DRAFT_478614 [Jimgerdemannia flammicorona]|uniref:Uncharacterized protein n=1 Tax=Jimgerdemannia flammicorona TaxID=994334 RepID=A0A433QML9_9FUNG|nr:hypothetical protein BC938DRAFT_478614 [Jimgerdemannia flammicorona]